MLKTKSLVLNFLKGISILVFPSLLLCTTTVHHIKTQGNILFQMQQLATGCAGKTMMILEGKIIRDVNSHHHSHHFSEDKCCTLRRFHERTLWELFNVVSFRIHQCGFVRYNFILELSFGSLSFFSDKTQLKLDRQMVVYLSVVEKRKAFHSENTVPIFQHGP